MTAVVKAGLGAPPPPTIYETSELAVTPGGGFWSVGLTLSLGYSWNPKHTMPQPVVHLADTDVSPFAALSVDKFGCLEIQIDSTSASPIMCSSNDSFYLACSATLSADGESFMGSVTSVCAGGEPLSVHNYWRGEATNSTAVVKDIITYWTALNRH